MTALDDSTLDHLRGVLAESGDADSRYLIRRTIGEGGMGTVYLADDTALDRPVAMKVIRDGRLGPDAVDRMLREARVIARLEHPGIVPVHDVGRLPDGRVFYVMKWVKGRRLDEYFDASATIAQRLRVFERVCETVAFAHAHGVIHRDLKPQNIMVGEFGEVLVLDWGVAKLKSAIAEDPQATVALPAPSPRLVSGFAPPVSSSPRHTQHGTILGTPAYMAPEQARGEIDRVDERSDVFALGGVLFFLLTGRPPREQGSDTTAARSARALNRNVSRRLNAVSAKAMAPLPDDRYASAAQLAQDVSRFLNGQAVSAYREGVLERVGRWAWWYRTPLLLVAAYLAMRAVLIVWQRP